MSEKYWLFRADELIDLFERHYMQEIKMTTKQENQMDDLFYKFQDELDLLVELLPTASPAQIKNFVIEGFKMAYMQGTIDFGDVMQIKTSEGF